MATKASCKTAVLPEKASQKGPVGKTGTPGSHGAAQKSRKAAVIPGKEAHPKPAGIAGESFRKRGDSMNNFVQNRRSAGKGIAEKFRGESRRYRGERIH